MENYLLDLVVAAIEKTERKVFAIPTEEESLKLFSSPFTFGRKMKLRRLSIAQ